MFKNLFVTSEQKYTTPIIEVEELEKRDVLTVSDNVDVNAQQFDGQGAPSDLLDSIFNG